MRDFTHHPAGRFCAGKKAGSAGTPAVDPNALVEDTPESGDLKHGDFRGGKNREIEIKFGVLGKPENLTQIFSEIGLVSNPCVDELENVYFDTPDQAMFRIGAGLRIRHGRELSEQTLKLRGKNLGGIHSRREFNIPIPRSLKTPDLKKFPSDVFPEGFDVEAVQKDLTKACTIRFRRESFDFEIMDCLFEVAYDHGSIQLANGGAYPINELEVELKRSDLPEASVMLVYNALLTTFAEKGIPLVLEPFSKMHRATVLIKGERNNIRFPNSEQSADIGNYIRSLVANFENLYGLFLLKHDPSVFAFQNATLRTLIRALKVLLKQGPAAFYQDERDPVDYKPALKIIIKSLKGYEKDCRAYEKKVAKSALVFDEFTLSALVDKLRKIENRSQIFVIPLKLRVLLSMLVRNS